MYPRTVRCMGIAAAAAGAVVCWYLLTREPDLAACPAGRGTAGAAGITGAERTALPPLPPRDSPDFRRLLLERAQPWLDARGRDAAGLISVWDLTRDKSLRDEAATKYPNDPRVCMAMIQNRMQKYLRRMASSPVRNTPEWLDRLVAAEPDNPEGLYQKAQGLVEGTHYVVEGNFEFVCDRPAALALLRKAAEMSGIRNDHLAERMQSAYDAATTLGVSPRDAAGLALHLSQWANTTSDVLAVASGVILEELAAAQASGDEARLVEIIDTGLRIAGSFDRGPRTVRNEMAVNDLESSIVARLPPDTRILYDGNSASEWSAYVTARRDQLLESARRADEAAALLDTASEKRFLNYFLEFTSYGEVSARSGLLPQVEPRK